MTITTKDMECRGDTILVLFCCRKRKTNCGIFYNFGFCRTYFIIEGPLSLHIVNLRKDSQNGGVATAAGKCMAKII